MDVLRIRGARQNNLQGVDLELPLGRLIVITGPSGSGKSSLAFQTLYAEGQRRYIETFSPYTRQFLERMDKPRVDSIEGIPPAIALSQANSIRTSRSTVGTLTEISDYLKLLFSRLARAVCPSCGRPVEPETPASIVHSILQREKAGARVLVTFPVDVPPRVAPAEFFAFLHSQGWLRVLLYGRVQRTDDAAPERLPARLSVVQDRIDISPSCPARLAEALEAALRLGRGQVGIWSELRQDMSPHSSGWHCAHCDVDLRPPTPGLFSFNNPLGACPECKGFGRVIGIDWERVLPDRSLSLAEGVVRPFQSGFSRECQQDLLKAAARREVDIHRPFEELPEADQRWVIEGDGPGSPEELWEAGRWYGVRGYFQWLETKTYKMHVRVLLSRYRSYCVCPACRGGRFRPEALCYRLPGLDADIASVCQTPFEELQPRLEAMPLPEGDPSVRLLHGQILSRVRCLNQAGLGYLVAHRPARTLSGGEIERVHLTACIGAALSNTLFVLDEPSVGLHPRDTERLVGVLEALRDRGNTVVVVEHEEAVIRRADHLVDVGPGRGREGGRVVYNGAAAEFESGGGAPSLTRDYLTGRKKISVPSSRRRPAGWLRFRGIRHNNLRGLDVDIPLGVLCCVTGVSGSGKSSLVQGVIYPALCREAEAQEQENPAFWRSVRGAEALREVLLVDQTPLARTPRSTPAVYAGAWDAIRTLLGTLPEALAAGLSPSSFSFNSGDGRCGRCGGLGFEKVEMQFLSDLFLRCPECEGRRFRRAVLEVRWRGLSAADILELPVDQALEVFQDQAEVVRALRPLADVGLGYLRLGQPLNELSGGESQRLKLAARLALSQASGSLLIFDEPTTGLHFDDIARLLGVFQQLAEAGASLLVVEHNLEVIKCADWIVDLGPEAGERGGRIVVQGTPEDVAACNESHTGRYLRQALAPASAKPLPRGSSPSPPALPQAIRLRGAREHNLKNISLDIPHGELVVVTGLSGSGKSTLAFDVLFAEGQRRFLDSMSAYARQFVEQMEKPEVDALEGLPPTVAIEQRVTRGGAKSTVATITEIWHFLRLLYARVGVQHCPQCKVPVSPLSPTAAADLARKLARRGSVRVLAPLVRGRKGFHAKIAAAALRAGVEKLLVDGKEVEAAAFPRLDRYREHTIEAIVAETAHPPSAEAAALRALDLGAGFARILDASGQAHILSTVLSCPNCARAFEPLDPRLFSFHSAHGWCPHCRGFGEVWRPVATRGLDSELEAELAEERAREGLEDGEAQPCPVCRGTRLNETAAHVLVDGVSLCEFAQVEAPRARQFIQRWKFTGAARSIAAEILPEIQRRLDFLEEVGLGYLSLGRGAHTLSGGEAQRVRLAAQLGSNLRGVLYVLDEPTIGLHARDNARLLDALEALAARGNSLLVVEHDEETMRRASHIIDLGPGAGAEGGQVVVQGPLAEILSHPTSATAQALREPLRHPLRGSRRAPEAAPGWVRIRGARLHNLRGVEAAIPLERLTVVAGVSGSGKSSLIRGVLEPALRAALGRGQKTWWPSAWEGVEGADHLGGVLVVDQSPIGKTSRSTPATYIKVLDAIRELYAGVPAARMRGYTASRFSFNNEGGRCEACQGQGVIRVEMNFLPPAFVPCEECRGARFNAATLEITWNGKSIGEVMTMTASEALQFFSAIPKIRRPLELMVETGLGYLQLGQPSPTLSGGEAQRLKLVSELARRATSEGEKVRTGRRGKSVLYILEEPTIGLHALDVRRLLHVLHRLVEEGGTVVVIEHHLDVIAEADWIVELGPGAGEDGGQVIAQGTPEQIAQRNGSPTAPFLARVLASASFGGRRASHAERGNSQGSTCQAAASTPDFTFRKNKSEKSYASPRKQRSRAQAAAA